MAKIIGLIVACLMCVDAFAVVHCMNKTSCAQAPEAYCVDYPERFDSYSSLQNCQSQKNQIVPIASRGITALPLSNKIGPNLPGYCIVEDSKVYENILRSQCEALRGGEFYASKKDAINAIPQNSGGNALWGTKQNFSEVKDSLLPKATTKGKAETTFEYEGNKLVQKTYVDGKINGSSVVDTKKSLRERQAKVQSDYSETKAKWETAKREQLDARAKDRAATRALRQAHVLNTEGGESAIYNDNGRYVTEREYRSAHGADAQLPKAIPVVTAVDSEGNVTSHYRDLAESKREDKNKARDAELKERRAARREDRKLQNAMDIQEVNTDGTYGGKYGGLDGQVTQQINDGVTQVSTVANTMATARLEAKKLEEQTKLTEKGLNVTAADYNETQNNIRDATIKANKTTGWIHTIAATAQAITASLHMTSKSKVDAAAAAANGELASDTTLDPNAKAMIQDTIAVNEQGEKSAQNQLAARQTAATMGTTMMAYRNFADAKALNNMPVTGPTGPGMSFQITNGLTPGEVPTDQVIVPESTQDQVLTDAAFNQDPGPLDDVGQINPNGLDNLPAAPSPGQFMAGGANGPGGGPGGGIGGAGNTSAAKPEDSQAGASNGKDKNGGSYGSAGGPGRGGRSMAGGNSKGVGLDNAFADLLKKFLPGGEEDKKKDQNGALNFTDRALASDQAAVMGRNKNIFDEIHKRYQKKSAEGAILF